MRLRLRFSKLGKVRFTSHRDVARMWERALRRTGLRAAYTAGFSPRPKIAFGLALPTGAESLAEYLDLELAGSEGLDTPEDLGQLPARLSAELPLGVDVAAVAPLEPGSPSLQEAVESCSWKIEATGVDVPAATLLVARAMGADSLVLTRTRKGKEVTDDLRPALLHVSVSGPTAEGVELDAELGVHPRSLRPSELLLALSPDGALQERRVLRTAQWIWHDGARREPLATSSPPREDLHVRDRIPWPHPAVGVDALDSRDALSTGPGAGPAVATRGAPPPGVSWLVEPGLARRAAVTGAD
jgi:radical SAM-linked protein